MGADFFLTFHSGGVNVVCFRFGSEGGMMFAADVFLPRGSFVSEPLIHWAHSLLTVKHIRHT